MERTPAELRAIIMAAPDPLVGHILDYDQAATAAAKAMLIICKEDPSLLALPDGTDAFDRAYHDAHWKTACARWPGLDQWLGGLSGFQLEWANGAVRYIMGEPPAGNPAIATISR